MTKFLDFKLHDNRMVCISSPYFKLLQLEIRENRLDLVLNHGDIVHYFLLSDGNISSRMKKSNEAMRYIREKTGLNVGCEIISLE